MLGLGAPQPFVPNFSLHPLAPLLAWMQPVPWVRLLLIAHGIAGAIGMWRLGVVLDLPPIVRATGVVTFLLAAPVQNYVLSDFWPSHYVVWTLLPWVLLTAWNVMNPSTSDDSARRSAAGLGLVSGVVAANANPAHLFAFIPLAFATGVVRWRHTRRRTGWIAAAALIAAAIAAPLVVQLVTERQYFDPELELSTLEEPLPFRAAWMALTHPFLAEPTTRTLFFGGPYAALALAGCFWFARQHADLVLGFLVSAALLFTAVVPIPWLSARYQFRDPVTLCGILLAGLAVSRIMARRKASWIGPVALGVQLFVAGAGAAPTLARQIDRDGVAGAVFHGAVGETPLMDTIVGHMPSRGRLLYSPRVSRAVAERAFVIDGLGVNSPAYRGIPVVNGWFKGVSVDAMWPTDRLFYGLIDTPRQLLESDDALDVLAIRHVLAYRDEPVAAGLRRLIEVTTARGAELILYENPDTWPTAFLVRSTLDNGGLPVIPGCGHDRVLCRDLGALAGDRDSTSIQVLRAADHIRITWAQASTPTMLVISEMFRPGWTAFARGRRMATTSVLGGLLGVPLPAGAGEVTLYYRPRAHRLALVVCLAGIIAGIGLMAARPRWTLTLPFR